jgi:hypothetical protein
MTDRRDGITISSSAIRRAGLALLFLIVLLLIALGITCAVGQVRGTDSLAAAINPNEYQAVFLTNGQIYFGRLTSSGGDFYYLRHVYYLTAQASGNGRPLRRQLVKLTSDVHGPEDMIAINRAQVLYVENLRPNGAAAKLLGGSTSP